jgi:hypothetical protein
MNPMALVSMIVDYRHRIGFEFVQIHQTLELVMWEMLLKVHIEVININFS